MKQAILVFLAVLVTTIPFVQAQDTSSALPAQTQADQGHTRWIDHVMESIATIKPGMTREDLVKIFTTEGGLSTSTQRRYVYKHCPHIKVDVEFAPVDNSSANQHLTAENPADKIVKISHPFLEYSIWD